MNNVRMCLSVCSPDRENPSFLVLHVALCFFVSSDVCAHSVTIKVLDIGGLMQPVHLPVTMLC